SVVTNQGQPSAARVAVGNGSRCCGSPRRPSVASKEVPRIRYDGDASALSNSSPLALRIPSAPAIQKDPSSSSTKPDTEFPGSPFCLVIVEKWPFSNRLRPPYPPTQMWPFASAVITSTISAGSPSPVEKSRN